MARILLVDDDRQIRDMLKMTLERGGHEVVEAEDGVQAIEKYEPTQMDLVITDIVMPEKEGIETIMELRGIDPEVKIIAISGGGRINPSDYLNWARRFGVKHTFTKPVERNALLQAIEELLGQECKQN
ncbi:MAG: response regulator [bacterium]|nr:response regulator [bacterium]